MLQTSAFSASAAGIRCHFVHHPHLVFVDFDSLDDRSYDGATGLPVGFPQPVGHFLSELFHSADDKVQCLALFFFVNALA
jgi:hypothetical protein